MLKKNAEFTHSGKETNFSRAFYALDNKVKGPFGLTERQRARVMIEKLCEVSRQCVYSWLVDVSLIKKTYRHDIALIMNCDPKTLFEQIENK
jgi:hypothetical protein